MGNLTIFNSSAGSGKTYRLTLEYIKIAFRNPGRFRHILAVTFTNKATSEMKDRILGELYRLSENNSPEIKRILVEEGHPENEIESAAKNILSNILHDYSRFSIHTIDSFFQRVIKSFFREMSLKAGYELQINSDEVVDKSIGNLLEDFNPSMNETISGWLMDFAGFKIEEQKSWYLENDLKKFSKEIFSEEFMNAPAEFQKKLKDLEFMKALMKNLLAKRNQLRNEIKEEAGKCLSILENRGLTIKDIFRGTSGPMNIFRKYCDNNFESFNKTVKNAIDDPDCWSTKTSKNKALIVGLANEYFNPALIGIEPKLFKLNSVEAALSNFYSLGLLGDINKYIQRYSLENNLSLLSDTTRLIYELVKDNDVPFIYEKHGSYFDHIMIDEFQDTSEMQWKNFEPLVRQSVDQGFSSLLVGDIKQSIYRWRNSDWKLLASIANPENQSFQPEIINLDKNWRSLPGIVEFNNDFFEKLKALVKDFWLEENSPDYKNWVDISYSNLKQNLPEKEFTDRGMTRITFIEKKEYDDKIGDELIKAIVELQDKGYKAGDIAILIRANKESAALVETLNKGAGKYPGYNFRVLSNESYFLKNSRHVNFILDWFRYLQNKEDSVARLNLLYGHYQFLDLEVEILRKMENEIRNWTSDEFMEHLSSTGDFKSLFQTENSLFEITEKLIRSYKLFRFKGEAMFLNAFQDSVINLKNLYNSDISGFLEWWETEGIKKTVNMTGDMDAIRIITIHKAKGLQFRAVLMPNCNWAFVEHKNNRVWCHSVECNSPVNSLETYPVAYSEKLKDSCFNTDYQKEFVAQCIDNMNLMYVAFTRAQEVLMAWAQKPGKNKGKGTNDALYHILSDNEKFQSGDIPEKRKPAASEKSSIFEIGYVESSPWSEKLQLSKTSGEFLLAENGQINRGKIIHELLSTINTANDLEKYAQKMVSSGFIAANEKEELLKQLSRKIFALPHINWFNGELKNLNERSLCGTGGKVLRPDRVLLGKNASAVVVDFKTGGHQSSSHKRQVKEYMTALASMKYSDVKGFLWYIDQDEVVNVEPDQQGEQMSLF